MILVVDDDKILSQLMRTLLENAGYTVTEANDGQTAWKHMQDPRCRAVLLDIQMPGINGAELLMLMSAEGLDIPVLVVAAFPDFDQDEMKEFPNVKQLFHKPFYPEDLLKAVRKHALPRVVS